MQHIGHPRRQFRMDPVVDPQARPAIAHQFRFPQESEMTGYGRLGSTDSVRQLADTEFIMFKE